MMLIDADVSVAERKGDRGYWLHVRQSLWNIELWEHHFPLVSNSVIFNLISPV